MRSMGSARMLEHALAHPVDDEPTRLVALMLENVTLALKIAPHLAQATGKTNKRARVLRRLDKVLVAAKARAPSSD